MRDTFAAELESLISKDSNIIFLTGDLGFGVFDSLRKNYPENFLNIGVAEQNMTGIAAGLAMEGFKVFTYSIANFSTLRCLEQLRNDASYHELNVLSPSTRVVQHPRRLRFVTFIWIGYVQ